MKTVDTHAHIFSLNGPFASNARYRPAVPATVSEYIGNLDRHRINYGVLIQPSFLGVDNREMIAAIAGHPGRLKGVAVVPLDVGTATLQSLGRQGIVGARLNLFGQPVPELNTPAWQTFLERLSNEGWQLELHCPPAYLRSMLPALKHYAGPIVIDHFGRIDSGKGVDDPDYRCVLSMLDPARYWVKISGHYRLGEDTTGMRHAQQALALLLAQGMREHLVWGSDWPHTQYDDRVNYDATVRFLDTLLPDEPLRMRILGENALSLYGFAA